MKRRDFGKALVDGAVGVGLSTLIPATKLAVGQHVPDYGPFKPVTPKKNLKMHVGSDYHVIEGPAIFSKENLEYNIRFGVKSISPDPDQEAHRGKPRPRGSGGGDFILIEGPVEGGAFDLDLLKRMKDSCDAAGIWLEGLRMDSGYIILKQKSDQDKKLDQISENIRKAAQVDVHLISQHWTMIPIRRNGTAPGRGGAVYTTFKLENDWKSLPEGVAGHVSYNDSPWNGFQLDLGVIGEGSTNVNKTEPDLVRYMLQRGKVKQVHMRNIKGGLNDFQEVYPDEGVIDFFKIMRIFRE